MGRDECDISSTSLYTPPTGDGALRNVYCQNRAALLDAMSNAGRHEADTSYDSQGKLFAVWDSFLGAPQIAA